jgi:thiol-disulfide isomerase/thioredoxin
MTSITSLPNYPLTNLATAEFTATTQAFKGTPTVIDFWTTKCTRCPAALDELDAMASSPIYKNVKFASICCDLCDGAREILEQTDEPRWSHVDHYFMGFEYKELAKKVLGFKSVPFIVVLNEEGEIVQMGSKKQIDFDNIPGMVKENSPRGVEETNFGERSFVLDMDF